MIEKFETNHRLERFILELAEAFALEDLDAAGIKPNSPAGREFMSRVRQFGITVVNPPLTEKETQVTK